MSNAKHTFQYIGQPADSVIHQAVIRDPSGKRIGEVLGRTVSEVENRAAFIVRAVNSHEELLDACKTAFSALQQLKNLGDAEDWEAYQPLHAAYDALKATIVNTLR